MTIDWDKSLVNDYGDVSAGADRLWVQTNYVSYSVDRVTGVPKHPDLPKSFTVRNKQTVEDMATVLINERFTPAMGGKYIAAALKEAGLLKEDE